MEKERKKKKIDDEEYHGNGTLTEYIVKEGIEEIGEDAFSFCFHLETISFSRGIRKIGRSAFQCCRKIGEIILKEGLEEIGDDAFWLCVSLTHVVLVKGIRKIGKCAFGDTALTHFEMNEGLEEVRMGIFAGCEKLKTISFPLHQIRTIHKHALTSHLSWKGEPKGPPLALKTLILRTTYRTPPSIPFPTITNDDDDGQLVRFIEIQQKKYLKSELRLADTVFFACFSLKCGRMGLYNAYGVSVLARICRFWFRGPSLHFPIRRLNGIRSCADEHNIIGGIRQ